MLPNETSAAIFASIVRSDSGHLMARVQRDRTRTGGKRTVSTPQGRDIRLVLAHGAGQLAGSQIQPHQTSGIPVDIFPNGISHYLWGGFSIGAGVALLFLLTGLVGGMSTVYSSTWSFVVARPFFQQASLVQSRRWRLAYAAGLVMGAAAWWFAFGGGARLLVDLPWWRLLVGGVMAGYGARLSQGCTSGHGICGLASLRLPSLAAVLTFMATAMITATLAARLLGS